MKLRASLLAALVANGGIEGARTDCPVDNLSEVSKGQWICEKDGTTVPIGPGLFVEPETKCQVQCITDHFIMRPGIANFVRCKGKNLNTILKRDVREIKNSREIPFLFFRNKSILCPLIISTLVKSTFPIISTPFLPHENVLIMRGHSMCLSLLDL